MGGIAIRKEETLFSSFPEGQRRRREDRQRQQELRNQEQILRELQGTEQSTPHGTLEQWNSPLRQLRELSFQKTKRRSGEKERQISSPDAIPV